MKCDARIEELIFDLEENILHAENFIKHAENGSEKDKAIGRVSAYLATLDKVKALFE